MTKNEIIGQLAKERGVERIIRNVSRKQDVRNPEDLAQMIYLELLEKPDSLIVSLNERKQLNYFLTRIVLNNIFSKNSRYHYLYRKWSLDCDEFSDIEDEGDDNDWE